MLLKNYKKRLQRPVLTRRLTELTKSGCPLHKSLDILIHQSRNQLFRGDLVQLKKNVAGGKSFSEAIALQESLFPPVYVGLIQAGESTGQLEQSLEECTELMEQDQEVRKQFISALAYPVFLLLMSIAVSVFITVFIIPRYEVLFLELGQTLPWPTRIMMNSVALFKKGGLLFLFLLLAVSLWGWNKKDRFKKWAHAWLLSIPIIGPLWANFSLHRWYQSMAALLKSGYPLVEALNLSQCLFSSSVFKDQIKKVVSRVETGKSLGSAFQESNLFTEDITEIVSASEESASLEQTFQRLATITRRETEFNMKTALTFLEPGLILAMGLIVGFVALSLLLPVFEMSATLK